MDYRWARWVLGLVLFLPWGPCPGASGESPEDGTKRLIVSLVHPRQTAGELRLVPGPQEMIDEDGFALYAKAFEAMPKDLDWGKIKAWREVPLKELPQGEIQSLLQRCQPAVELLEQAGKCKECDWPYQLKEGSPMSLQACRNAAFLLALQARVQLTQSDYASCVRTLRTGFALARHLGTGPTLIHVLVDVAISSALCGEIELYAQQPGAPSLEAALRAIPCPWVNEQHSELYGMDEAGRSRALQVLRRVNRHMIALRYIEALRRYGIEASAWPRSLDELKADLPDDPGAGKPFAYERLSETRAVLSGPLPKGGDAKDVVRYELNLVK